MLSFLYLENYKNLALPDKVELKNLNIIIGSNGSGKSNLINCLKFLKNYLTIVTEQSQGISNFENAIYKIGGEKILDKNILSPAQVRFAYGFNISKIYILDLKFFCDGKKVRLAEQDLYEGETLYKHYSKQEKEKPEEAKQDLVALMAISINNYTFFDVIDNSESYLKNNISYKNIKKIGQNISRWQFYNANNMDLNLIRTSEPKLGPSDIYLSPSGDNLALVLENLISEDLDFEERINLAIKSIFPTTRRIISTRSGRLSLTVEWHIEGIKEPFYLDEMSDGTVRMLCWATILLSSQLPTLLVIDEPELGLHVAWMPILAEWIKEAATKTQVIITSHSPDLLDHFTNSLENVFCFYASDKSHFSITNLSKDLLETKLDEGWQLGDLYRVGDPSVGG